jgi:hypothetical protein
VPLSRVFVPSVWDWEMVVAVIRDDLPAVALQVFGDRVDVRRVELDHEVSDRTAPHRENSEVVYERYTALGGPVERIVQPGADRHPHELSDSRPIVEFFDRAWRHRSPHVGAP